MRTAVFVLIGIVTAQSLLIYPVIAQEKPATTLKSVAELEANKKTIQSKQGEIEALEKKIQTLQSQRTTTANEAAVIEEEVKRLEKIIETMQLQVRQTRLSITHVQGEQYEAKQRLQVLEQDIGESEEQLKYLLQRLYQHNQQSFLHMILQAESLSAALAQQHVIEELQQRMLTVIKDLQTKTEAAKEKQVELSDKEIALRRLHTVLAQQEEEQLAQKKNKEIVLQTKERETTQIDHRIAEARAVRGEIEKQLFQLKGAGVEIKLNDAYDMARYAGNLTGVRPALIMGVLKIETNVGENLGSGVYPEDMHPDSREAFIRVTQKLGLDPHKTPISARPRSYRGWGGAMGPGQFMPATWETIEARVAALIKKDKANPYELSHAFVGTAIMLADRGATSRAGEYEAVNRYLAGPNWQYVTWYGDKVLAVAEEYEQSTL